MRVLLVENDDGNADLVTHAMGAAGAEDVCVSRVDRLHAAAERLGRERFDVVLLDLALPDARGLDALQKLRAAAPELPIVVLTATDTVAGTSAIQNGAQDFLRKEDVSAGRMLSALRHAVERSHFGQRTQLLSDVTGSMNGAPDPARMMATLCDKLGHAYADRCHVEGRATEAPNPQGKRLKSPHAPRLFASLRESLAADVDRERIDLLLSEGITSAMVVPFSPDAWPPGVLTLARTAGSPPYGPADLALAEEIVRRLVGAIDHLSLLEAAEKARERAEVASRVRDEFLATLSHELRTPLNAILGWSQILSSGKMTPERQQRGLDTIERSARAQAALIDDVLDVSRIVTGKMRLKVGAVQLTAVITSALESVRPAADAKGVKLETVGDLEGGVVRADPDRLLQVLWNLLSNAVKFTPRDGRVAVTVKRNDSTFEVAVSDTGNGIAPDFLPYVFERFRQEDSSMTRAHGGLGLGLAIARHLIELQGGTLRAESDGLGKGATFVMRLPVAALATATEADARTMAPFSLDLTRLPATQVLAGVRVLVVDDDEDTRGLLETMMEDCGAVVATATSAQEGLQTLRAFRPDVLVSDIGMPTTSGYDFIKSVRRLPPGEGNTTPSVALTAYARKEDRVQALHCGFDQHVSKPVTPSELVAVITSLTRRGRASG